VQTRAETQRNLLADHPLGYAAAAASIWGPASSASAATSTVTSLDLSRLPPDGRPDASETKHNTMAPYAAMVSPLKRSGSATPLPAAAAAGKMSLITKGGKSNTKHAVSAMGAVPMAGAWPVISTPVLDESTALTSSAAGAGVATAVPSFKALPTALRISARTSSGSSDDVQGTKAVVEDPAAPPTSAAAQNLDSATKQNDLNDPYVVQSLSASSSPGPATAKSPTAAVAARASTTSPAGAPTSPAPPVSNVASPSTLSKLPYDFDDDLDALDDLKLTKTLQPKDAVLRILLVDDQDFNLFVMENMLQSMKISMMRAVNGLEAVSAFERCMAYWNSADAGQPGKHAPFDLILMDCYSTCCRVCGCCV